MSRYSISYSISICIFTQITEHDFALKHIDHDIILKSLLAFRGPVHTFNGHSSNFYIVSEKNVKCGNLKNSQMDADYFCQSLYGPSFKARCFSEGYYDESDRMGTQIHRASSCFYKSYGHTMTNTYCSGGTPECRTWYTSSNYQGLYDIVCEGNVFIPDQSARIS